MIDRWRDSEDSCDWSDESECWSQGEWIEVEETVVIGDGGMPSQEGVCVLFGIDI